MSDVWPRVHGALVHDPHPMEEHPNKVLNSEHVKAVLVRC
jgi:hypothetical protein